MVCLETPNEAVEKLASILLCWMQMSKRSGDGAIQVCRRKPDTTKTRQVAVLTRRSSDTHTQNMRARIDSALGREEYGRRFATVEPVFGNIRNNKRLNRFTLRGRHKVDGQWKLFALVHNIEKWVKLRKAT